VLAASLARHTDTPRALLVRGLGRVRVRRGASGSGRA